MVVIVVDVEVVVVVVVVIASVTKTKLNDRSVIFLDMMLQSVTTCTTPLTLLNCMFLVLVIIVEIPSVC